MSEGGLRRNIGALLALQGANYLLPLVTVPYLVRVLGPETFGRIAFAQAFVAYFVFVTDYGFNLTATRAVAQARHDLQALSSLVSAVMLVKSTIMALGFLVMLAIVFAMPEWREDWPLFAWAYLAAVGSALFPLWLLHGMERMIEVTVYTMLARLAVIAAIFLLVRESADYHIAAALQGGAMVIAGALAFLHLPRVASIAWRWPGASTVAQVTRDAWHVFLASFAGNVANSSNVFVLGLVAPPTVVGYFAAAEKLIRALQGLIYPVSQSVFPRVARLLECSADEALALVSRLARTFFVGAFSVFVFVLAFAGLIASAIYGEGFGVTGDLLRLMAVMPLLAAMNNILGAQTLAQFGFVRFLSASALIPAALHVLALYFVSVAFTADGVALLVVLTEFFILSIRVAGLAYKQPDLLRRIVFG